MKSIAVEISPENLAKLNLISILHNQPQKETLSKMVKVGFESIKPEITRFEIRVNRFNKFKKAAGIKRVYRKRKARKVKAK